jgi:hypothetical protein
MRSAVTLPLAPRSGCSRRLKAGSSSDERRTVNPCGPFAGERIIRGVDPDLADGDNVAVNCAYFAGPVLGRRKIVCYVVGRRGPYYCRRKWPPDPFHVLAAPVAVGRGRASRRSTLRP